MSRRQYPISETTNQEHTSRGRHKVFNKVENPHQAESPKWPRQNNQVDKSADTKLYLNIRYSYLNLRIKGDKHTPLTIFPDLGQAQIICGGVKLVSLDPNPPPIYG